MDRLVVEPRELEVVFCIVGADEVVRRGASDALIGPTAAAQEARSVGRAWPTYQFSLGLSSESPARGKTSTPVRQWSRRRCRITSALEQLAANSDSTTARGGVCDSRWHRHRPSIHVDRSYPEGR